MMNIKDKKICVLGLGYVGLPLLSALSKSFEVVGFDTNKLRIQELRKGHDSNNSVDQDFNVNDLTFTDSPDDLAVCNVYIIAVPTPITRYKTPELSPLREASKYVAQNLSKGDLVIYESTVFPGCTEEVCLPILEQISGLKLNDSFWLGYSPERINPGDEVHRLDNTMKIIAGSDETAADLVQSLYNKIVTAGTHRAPSIRVAEAAKIVENVQRDVNIALMNELSLIFDKLNINTYDVLDAAKTKWNFHPYTPGLVGGHCISVDPYYLTYKAEEVGYVPDVILSGRKVNDRIVKNVSNKVIEIITYQDIKMSEARVLILGITFKENVSDIRNSKVVDLIRYLQAYSIAVDVFDPLVDELDKQRLSNIKWVDKISPTYNCTVLAVPHKSIVEAADEIFASISMHGGLIDIKGIFRDQRQIEQYHTL